ncbi:MAG: hypothetical protein F2923_00315 [Actinobacteria bacterium]|nr:hypothetical protein [Actinomycetota bacterium]
MIRFLHWLFSVKKGSLIPSSGVVNLDFQVLNPDAGGENVLFDDGRIRVTPALIWIGQRKRIVVAQIREIQWGRIKEDKVGWVICKILLILLIGGALFLGLLQMWFYFSLCLIGIIESVWFLWKWPYCVSIRTSGLFGEYIDFSDRQAVDACGKAIEAAIKSRA